MHLLPFALLCTAFLVGCGSQPTPQEPQRINNSMEIAVDLRDEHRCSRISPEIEISAPPQGTDSILVSLVDMDDKNRPHGGGAWEPNNSGDEDIVIVEGALTRYYTGPCPPAHESRVYQYVVKALDVNKQLLGVGKYTFLQE